MRSSEVETVDQRPTRVDDSIRAAPKLAGVHGLRAIAALSVVLFHVHHLRKLALPGPFGFIGTHFGLGVSLFFVLSSFSLLYSNRELIGRENWLRDYFVKRVFRILPLYFFVLLVIDLPLNYFSYGLLPDVGTLLLNLTLSFNFVPGKHEGIVQASWTLGVEETFYVILPVLMLLVRNIRHAVLLCIGANFVSYLCRAGLTNVPGLGSYAHLAFISHVGVFTAGILAYHVFDAFSKLESAWRRRAGHVLFGCAVILTAGLFSPPATMLLVPGRPDVLIYGLVFGAVTASQSLWPSKLLANRFLQFVGERSYGVYLLHPLIIRLLGPLYQPVYDAAFRYVGSYAFFVCALMTIVPLLLAAAVAYELIEAQGIRFGRRLIAAWRADGDRPRQTASAVTLVPPPTLEALGELRAEHLGPRVSSEG